MATTYQLISSVTVGSGGASSIDFTSIPATYTDLVVKGSLRATGAGAGNAYSVYLQLNTVTTNRTYRRLYGYGSSTGSDNGSTAVIATAGGTGGTANTFDNFEIYIPNYAGSTNKSFSVDGVAEDNSSANNELDLVAGLWSSTAAITAVGLTINGQTIAQYSTAYLYGIKNS